jgi:hemerythrin superfamily protein
MWRELAVENLTDSPDVVALLLGQHREIRSTMVKVDEAAASERGATFAPLVALLAVHETAEEIVVYPALARSAGDEGARVADARKAEEDEAKKMLADLEDADPATDEFMSFFRDFRAAIEQHATAEENEVFPLLARTHTAEEMRALGAEAEVAERMAPTHGHRGAPESASGNLLLGPFVAMADRVRDALRGVRAPN